MASNLYIMIAPTTARFMLLPAWYFIAFLERFLWAGTLALNRWHYPHLAPDYQMWLSSTSTGLLTPCITDKLADRKQ